MRRPSPLEPRFVRLRNCLGTVEMRRTLRIVFLIVGTVAASSQLAAQPPAVGSQLPPDENLCATCHGEKELWDEDKLRLLIPAESLAEDIHFLKGVNCHDCHGGDPSSFDVPEAHSTVVEDADSEVLPFRDPVEKVWESCVACHQHQHQGVADGVHGALVEKGGKGSENSFDCRKCHGDKAHGMLAVRDSRSPVCLENQIELCGSCHQKELVQYQASTHGRGLEKSGLAVTAVCADCHGGHGIRPASDEQSSLHAANVAGTCAKCHRFIEERLHKSVHGGGNGLGGATEESAPGGEVKRRPTCTDCHEGHDLPHPLSAAFRLRLPGRCGNCHSDSAQSYAMSLHGQLTDLGYGAGAKCSDCHGAHDILAVDDPNSPLAAGENRLATCRECHPYAVPNFCNFLPHANPRDAERYPVLHAVRLAMEILIFSVFAFFGVHSVLWFLRSLIHVARHGRPRRLTPGATAYVRFEPTPRIFHVILVVTFLGTALTGLPLRYSDQHWAQGLARMLGGFGSTSIWHHVCAILMIVAFLAHLAWMGGRAWHSWQQGVTWRTLLFGPDSPVPNVRDFTDMFRMGRWFFGQGPKPVFERWSYWEKFDYWAVFWGVAIIGTSGLMLWFPNLASRILPGEALNVAKIIHSEEALLATSFIFAMHFFGTHVRPEKFPMDMSVLAGVVTEEELEDERPEFLERMRRDNRLDQLKASVPARRVLMPIIVAGTVALAIGVGLLIGIVLAVF